MKVFFGLLLTTLVNFTCGLAGFYIASNFLISFVPQHQNTVSTYDFLWSFLLKFTVILILTWIMYRVMSTLDTPKKRILFIFLLGSSFSIYNEVDIFWSNNSLTWSLIMITSESINWLISGYLLSKFVKPKHLGAF
tara:strand:- start:131 stop:538 length:408 start_codon:yes stop_codon:yes gene_type:complete